MYDYLSIALGKWYEFFGIIFLLISFFEVVYTMIMIPYNTLPVEMTKDFNQRTYLTGSKAMFGKVANFLAAAIPGIYFLLLQ
ncbi:MFS transporter [Escherichia coli]|nr:MFS transporter [Escherichia coli]